MIVTLPRAAFDIDRERIGFSIARRASNRECCRAIAMEDDCDLSLERIALETYGFEITRSRAEQICNVLVPIVIMGLHENIVRPVYGERMRECVAAGKPSGFTSARERPI